MLNNVCDKKMRLNNYRRNEIERFFVDLAYYINDLPETIGYDSWEQMLKCENKTTPKEIAEFIVADDDSFGLYKDDEIILAEINLSNNLNVTLPEDTLRLIINFHKDKSPHVIAEGGRDITDDVINDNGLIDIDDLDVFLVNNNYDNIQIHKKDNSAPEDFDEDDLRAKVLFTEVEDGGALIYNTSNDEYVIVTAEEVKNGLSDVYLGTVEFRIEVQE